MRSTPAGEGQQVDTVEVRLLGNLTIRDAAGHPVDLARFRTRKTLDLLRLLALRVGEPVSGSILVQRLWPSVPEQKGRASLRTAASTIRGVLGRDSIERRLDGLVLRGAWVDTVAFTNLAVEARIYLREGRPAQAVLAAREAESLYLHDFRADDDSASWVVTERTQLRAAYGRLLEDTAEAALSLGWYRDVEDFASRAIVLDPFSERPVRALMTAFAATGQVERAVRAFQLCRRALVEELGVDPSVQTEAVHLGILRGEVSAPTPRQTPFVGRDGELVRLVGLLRRPEDSGRASVVELRGVPGSGFLRLVKEACRQAGVGWGVVADGAADPPARQDAAAQVVVESARSFLRDAGRPAPGREDRGRVVRVVIAEEHDLDTRASAERRGWHWQGIDLPALDLESSARLAEAAFGGAVRPELLRALLHVAGTAPGALVLGARRMMRAGKVLSTSEGLALADETGGRDHTIDAVAMVARAMRALPAESHEVLHVLAVADTALSRSTVLELLQGSDPAAVQSALNLLVDVSILSVTADALAFRHPQAAIAMRAWLRPSVRRALSAKVASCPAVPVDARVSAWSRAGEPARARGVAAVAARESRAADAAGTTASQERATPPASSLRTGVDAAVAAAGSGRPQTTAPTRRPVVATGSRPGDVDDVAGELGLARGATREVAEQVLDHALRSAAAVHARTADPEAGDRFAAISLLLAERVLVPGRRLDALDEVLDDVRSHTTRPDLLGEAEVLRWLPRVLLGHAASVRRSVEAAAARDGTPAPVAARLRRLALLAEHDLGCASAQEVDPRVGQVGHWWRFMPHRLLVERSGLVLDGEHWPGGVMGGTPLYRQLQALAAADRVESAGRRVAALQLLRAAADDAVETGCTLMLPEIAARLVVLGSATDLAQARIDFDLMDDAVGDGAAHPRELFLRFIARAHLRSVRADGSGAAAAQAAAAVARRYALLPLARQADSMVGRFEPATRDRTGTRDG